MLKIFKNEQLVANAICKEMLIALESENPVFCLAAGTTPAKGYELFAQQVDGHPDLNRLKIVSLDEWVGIDQSNEGSCYQMLAMDLFEKINLSSEQIIFYNGLAPEIDAECARIDEFIQKNPITFSLMGVGMNGHIGLNEPGFPILDHGSVVELSDTTKTVAQKYFNELTLLGQGLTLGLKQITNSQRVIVVITGEHKAPIVKKIFMSADEEIPAKHLLGYDHIDFYLDEAAAIYLDEGVS